MPSGDTDVLCSLFKRFSATDGDSGGLQLTQVKSSAARAIKAKLCAQYPFLHECSLIDELMPKKATVAVAKCPNHVQVIVIESVPRFFSVRDKLFFPTLRTLHEYPRMMRRLRCDEGAIKFVLKGANVMCGGLTSEGAKADGDDEEVDADMPVAIFAEGKEHAIAVGVTRMSTEEMRQVNKGIGVENVHQLGDGLWRTTTIS